MPGQFNGNTFQTNVFGGTPAFEIIGVPAMLAKIREIQFTTGPLITAQVTVLGIGVAATVGVNQRAWRGMQSEDGAPANAWMKIATDWDTPPGQPTTFFRRVALQGTTAANGGQAIMKWPRGLTLPTSNSLVVWCVTAAALGNRVFANFEIEA